MVSHIYTAEIKLNKATASDTKASFLDLHLSILDSFVKTKVYDKRDYFDFYLLHFPDGDIPHSRPFGIYLSQRTCFA